MRHLLAVDVPLFGAVDDTVLYTVVGALIITALFALVWKSISKTALVAILALLFIVAIAVTR